MPLRQGRGRVPGSRRSVAVLLLCLLAPACSEPPEVSESLLDRVTTEETVVSMDGREAGVVLARIPAGFFENTRPPVLGRTLMDGDFSEDPSVCIISHPLWERFGAGESDAPLNVDGAALEVVGVMPEGFDIPEGADVWIPSDPSPP